VSSTPTFDPFAGGEILFTAPTTEPQREIWLAIELAGTPANLAYNECTSVRMRGPLDATALERAIRQLVQRHEALRTTFTEDGATFCVQAEPRFDWRIENLAECSDADCEGRRNALLKQEVSTPFDLVRGPLFRALLIRRGAEDHELVFTAHHIVCDGWSAGVMWGELPELYRATCIGAAPTLEPAARFSDYSQQARRELVGTQAVETERYWLETLGSEPPSLDLPTDFLRPPERLFDAARIDRLLPRDLVDNLRATGRRHGASLVATMLAAFDALLYRLTGQSDFVIGVPAAGQAALGMHSLVGHCVNTLPIRLTFDADAPFVEHLRSAKRALLDGAEHQALSFGALLTKLEIPRDPSRVPLIPILFNIDRQIPPVAVGDTHGEFFSNPRVAENFEVFINGTETDDGLVLETTYNTGLFRAETIERWLSSFVELLRGVAESPETPLGRLPVLSAEDRRWLDDVTHGEECPVAQDANVLALIAQQLGKNPGAIAVRDDREALTYAELDRQANHLARRLLALGVEPESCVGISLERGASMLVALLGVWKAGAAYVPLDPEYPPSRLEFAARDTGIRVLVTERALAHVLSGHGLERIWMDDERGIEADAPALAQPPKLAYVLHTSGSTGVPKGVEIEHRALVNFLLSMAREPGLSTEDVLVAVTTLSFDIAGLELYLPLVVGAQVVIAERETAMDGHQLAALLDQVGATVLQATPATWRLLVEADFRPPDGFKALCGGEALPRELAQELLTRVGALWNMYGPTETTIWSTCARVENAAEAITIGRPILNTTVYVLDSHGEMLPVGAPGELFIGGLGLARGYRGRTELTAERFLPDPFSTVAGARMYRTGDLVRFDGRGDLYFERRNDGQIKLRGFRIELGEIEAALEQHSQVRQAACVVRKLAAGDDRLVAYVVPASDAMPGVAALKEHLGARLPPHMVPQHIVDIDAMPLTPNGKVDRKALPTPALDSLVTEDFVAPRTEVQATLADIWADLLRTRRVGIHDPFFDLGGHSMLAARMLARVREAFGVKLPLRAIFQAQTIEALSAHVEAGLLHAREPTSDRSAGQIEEIDF
jgi:amino acid adenylation domain-containing protein